MVEDPAFVVECPPSVQVDEDVTCNVTNLLQGVNFAYDVAITLLTDPVTMAGNIPSESGKR